MVRSRRARHLAICCLCSTLALASSNASALDRATTNLVLSCSAQLPATSIDKSAPAPLADMCDDFVDFGASGTRRASASSATTFGSSPGAVASASGRVTGIPGGGAAADGTALVQHGLRVDEIQTPPVGGVTEVPIALAASGAVTASPVGELSSSSGESSVRIVGPGVDSTIGASAGVPSFPTSSFDDVVAIPNAAVGGSYSVTLRASCSADASSAFSVPTTVTADCNAQVDLGSVVFDQAAFDALMGANTFPLDDYFSIASSENLTTPVPGLAGPGASILSLALLTLSRAAIHAAGRRRQLGDV